MHFSGSRSADSMLILDLLSASAIHHMKHYFIHIFHIFLIFNSDDVYLCSSLCFTGDGVHLSPVFRDYRA